jgi:DNA-binding NarL/FixJ family response regulator
MISILIVDDHKIVCQAIQALLQSEPGFEVVGKAGDGQQGLELIQSLKPNILVTDLMMKGMNGIQLVKDTTRVSPQTRSLVLSMYGDEEWVLGALEAGAKGYVLKESSAEDLISAIQAICSGQIFLSQPLSLAKIDEYRDRMAAQK